MITATRLKLTPRDQGREIDPEDFDAASGAPGYHFEIIDGRVDVAPQADLPQHELEVWIWCKLQEYSQEHPEVINFVAGKSRVFVDRAKATKPEPDIAAYADFPHHLPRSERRWEDISPLVVVEVISAAKPQKDLVRNVKLYADVPSIKEYWVVDPRPDPDRPTLIVYRRRGKGWQKPITVPFAESYESHRVLPGFSLIVDPDA